MRWAPRPGSLGGAQAADMGPGRGGLVASVLPQGCAGPTVCPSSLWSSGQRGHPRSLGVTRSHQAGWLCLVTLHTPIWLQASCARCGLFSLRGISLNLGRSPGVLLPQPAAGGPPRRKGGGHGWTATAGRGAPRNFRRDKAASSRFLFQKENSFIAFPEQ